MTRRALGRGLDALIGGSEPEVENEESQEVETNGHVSAPVSHGGPSITMVPPDKIVASPFQPRRYFDPAKLEELIGAIKTQGVIEPLVVRPTTGKDGTAIYELIAGERRLRASRDAGLAAVPVIVRELDDRGALEMSLVENLLREDLNAIEEGRAFIRLSKEFSLTHEEIADRIGKSRPYVTNMIRLMELPLPVIDMIGRGELTGGQVRPLLTMGSPEAQVAAARSIVEGKISARGAEEISAVAREVRNGGGERAVSENDANLNALAESMQRALKRKVRIIRQRGKKPGRVEIEYYDEEDLNGLAEMLTESPRGGAARVV
jgi:ParB family transcriptional regulator, chromosome partitioning protein